MKEGDFTVSPGTRVNLANFLPSAHGEYHDKAPAEKALRKNIEQLATLQNVLYAQERYAVLIVIQAMDAAGKDSVIKHVMTGLNPQGCRVVSFKEPSAEELRHDYLWRCVRELPEKGRIGIFNRSYYEEVLITRVHPELLHREHLPQKSFGKRFWKERFEDINHFERHLTRNGTLILKFFLHVSKHEQKQRFLERLDLPDKQWKFSLHDIEERERWDAYRNAYEEALRHTSTAWAPWYIVPADHKWFTRLAISEIIIRELKKLRLRYPVLSDEQKKEISQAKRILLRSK